MILTAYPYIDEAGQEHPDLIHQYSSLGKKLRNKETGEEFDAAVDPYPCTKEYEETDIDITKFEFGN